MKFDGSVKIGEYNIKFYRRTVMSVIERGRDVCSIRGFIKTIKPQNMAWDEPTGQLFYKSEDGHLYKLNFEQVNENDYE